MLPENVRERIYVVAIMNGGRISAQALAIIAMIHGMDKEDSALFKQFCEENSIAVYDESDEAESESDNEDESEEEILDGDNSVLLDWSEVESICSESRMYVESLEVPKKVEHIKELLLYAADWMSLQKVKVIVYRFGLDGKGAHTMEETAREFGISPREVCRIEAEIFKVKDTLRRQRERRDFFAKESDRERKDSI